MTFHRRLVSSGQGGAAPRTIETAVVAGLSLLLVACEPSPSRNPPPLAVPEVADSGAGLPPAAEGPTESVDSEVVAPSGDETDVPREVDATAAPAPLALDPERMRAEIGEAWIIALPPEWEPFASDPSDPQASRLQLTEDGKPLGPANSVHKEIREEGGGAYSHWATALYFSTSDGANPQTSGRLYRIEIVAPN